MVIVFCHNSIIPFCRDFISVFSFFRKKEAELKILTILRQPFFLSPSYILNYFFFSPFFTKERKDAVIPLSTTLTLIDQTPNLCYNNAVVMYIQSQGDDEYDICRKY